jgi:hypothetical protein
MAYEYSLPIVGVPETVFIDCDGLFEVVNANVANLTTIAEPYGVSPGTLAAAKAHAQANKGTPDGNFDPLRVVENTLKDSDFNEFGERFISPQAGDLSVLYERESGPFISTLQGNTIPHSGLTHGKNPLYQYAKFARGIREAQAKGHGNGHLYVEVVNGEPAKGPHIEDTVSRHGTIDMEALTANGTAVALLRAERGVLADDRACSFEGLPAQGAGWHTKRPSAPAERRAELVTDDLRDRVTVVNSLTDIELHSGWVQNEAGLTVPGTSEIITPVAYRPAYTDGPRKNGFLITPDTTFAELREAAAAFAV